MKTNLYATVGDKVIQVKNKRGMAEDRTVEGPIVFATLEEQELTPEWFKMWYDWLQANKPGCIVRYCDLPKEPANG